MLPFPASGKSVKPIFWTASIGSNPMQDARPLRKMPSAKKAAEFFARQPFCREWIAQFCLYFTDIGVNFSYDIETNGELWLLNALGSRGPATILDIGANVGDWTASAIKAFPQSRIFCFEPNPPVYQELSNRVANAKGVTALPLAIGMTTGAATLNVQSGPHSGVSSLTKFAHHDSQVEVRATRGDEWLASAGLDHIDFMKLDVEGYELPAMKSFSSAFSQGQVEVVQIEFAGPNPHERIFLRDIYDFAEANGYLVGRLYQDFVLFKPYEIRDEWWHGPNYVLCRASNKATVDLLGRRKNRFHMRYLSLN
jgi:FkbM family methyltransferase